MWTKNLLLILIRNPELGKVKTRLSKDIGQEKSLTIYKELLKYTHKITVNIPAERWVLYSEKIIEKDMWETKNYKKKKQEGVSFGSKMLNAFKKGFEEGFKNIVLIGSDCIDLQAKHIEEAFLKLKKNTSVIGPSEDGGYYLIGLNKLIQKVFKNKSWGTETVFQDTFTDLKKYPKTHILETLNDIDFVYDIKQDSFLHEIINEK